jgi:hypothetical protein
VIRSLATGAISAPKPQVGGRHLFEKGPEHVGDPVGTDRPECGAAALDLFEKAVDERHRHPVRVTSAGRRECGGSRQDDLGKDVPADLALLDGRSVRRGVVSSGQANGRAGGCAIEGALNDSGDDPIGNHVGLVELTQCDRLAMDPCEPGGRRGEKCVQVLVGPDRFEGTNRRGIRVRRHHCLLSSREMVGRNRITLSLW